MDDVEERAQPVHFVQFARQGCGQIESETVDVHLQHPVAKAVHDELQHPRVAHVQRVSGAGVVHVVAGIVRDEAVVNGIVDAPERQRGPS